jgi:hypothetical protein
MSKFAIALLLQMNYRNQPTTNMVLHRPQKRWGTSASLLPSTVFMTNFSLRFSLF